MAAIKIMLIENQYQQFEELFWPLRALGYEVFPDISADAATNTRRFRAVMDEVRIILSGRYGPDKPKIAENNLLAYKDSITPDLYIIDHVLVGHDQAEKGFRIAKLFRDQDNTPILFLSRTPMNSKEVYDGLNYIVGPKAWLHKGFNGEEILKADFINKTIDSEIKKLLAARQALETGSIIADVRGSRAVNRKLEEHFPDKVAALFARLDDTAALTEEDLRHIADLHAKMETGIENLRDEDYIRFGKQLLTKKNKSS